MAAQYTAPRTLPAYVRCPACHGELNAGDDGLTCVACSEGYAIEQGIALLFSRTAVSEDVSKVQELYDRVAHEYDDVFASHVSRHYLDKRLGLLRRLLPGGLLLDVGCGTGSLGRHIAEAGYSVVGVDVSPGMLARALERGLEGAYAAFSAALPFADESFDLALTVATLHHLDTPLRVALTIKEMSRVVKRGGYVLIWDHNPLNPYWPIIMRRVPQDTGEERLVPLREILADVQDAGLEVALARRTGLIPDFVPASLMPLARLAESAVESTPALSWIAAHNVVVGRKR
jgi:SAM-dependent methyltransferase